MNSESNKVTPYLVIFSCIFFKFVNFNDMINNKEITFNQLFKEISPEEINDSVFTLVGKDFFAVTAGNLHEYNSMIGSGGGMGVLFKKPTTWCVLRANRYTLELILKTKTYTLSYFPDESKDQMMFLGSKSGRDSDKMKNVELTSIKTPNGNISYREARLIIECRLIQITTPDPDDFYTEEARNYLQEAYKGPNDYRKYIFGEITNVWTT